MQEKGQPVANARVRLSSPLTSEVQISTTDADGKFIVGPLTNFQFMVKQFGAPYYRYELQITVEGHLVQVFSEEGAGDAPSKAALTCDVARAVQVENSRGSCSPNR
jgi:hypothetical protein